MINKMPCDDEQRHTDHARKNTNTKTRAALLGRRKDTKIKTTIGYYPTFKSSLTNTCTTQPSSPSSAMFGCVEPVLRVIKLTELCL